MLQTLILSNTFNIEIKNQAMRKPLLRQQHIVVLLVIGNQQRSSQKLGTLPAGMAEPFARSFAKGIESLLAKQEEKLLSHMALPPELPAPLVESTDLRFRKGKRRAMTGLEAAEERDRDLSRQRRQKEREATTLAVADRAMGKKEKEHTEYCEWVADTQLRFSQTSQLSSLEGSPKEDSEGSEPGNSQANPQFISSDNEDNGEKEGFRNEAIDSENSLPTSSCRPKREPRPSAKQESQEWQIANGLISDPGAKSKARVLGKKKKNAQEVSQLIGEFNYIE
jgi:hypothetical protein